MTSPTPAPPRHPYFTFGLTWFGQFISLFGSSLTAFALGAHVYLETNSTTRFALLSFFSSAPLVLMSPFAGVLIDRWDRRKAMILSDLGSGAGTLMIWLLLVGSGRGWWAFRDWHFYPVLSMMAAFSAFRWPAWMATTPLLIPKQHLGRASGLTELSAGIVQVAAPMIAGSLVGVIGLHGILFIDTCSFLFAVSMLVIVRFPRPPELEPLASTRGATGKRTMRKDLLDSWNFLKERPGLVGLLSYMTLFNLCTSFIMVLITPLVLSFTDMQHLGVIASISGLGMMLGGIATSVWGGPKDRMRGVVGFPVMGGLLLMMAALPPSVTIVATAAAAFLFSIPLTGASAVVLWQTKVPLNMHGRMAAVRRMLTQTVSMLATLVVGPLADKVFEPLLLPGGALAGSVGLWIGTGKGRGIAFFFVVLGLVVLVASLVAWLSPRLRKVQYELPDLLGGAGSPGAAPAATLEPQPPLASGSTPS